jgi:hypothetical protein
MSNLEAALEYIKEGFRVFPVKLDKTPYTLHGLKDATQIQIAVREYWTKWPEAGIGVCTDGLIVLDFDKKNGGAEALKKIQDDYGKFPDTRVHRTGGGGLHFLYRNPNGTDIRNTVNAGGYKGMDIRANGGYIVVPPSIHASGRKYAKLTEHPVAIAPDWLAGIAKTKIEALNTFPPGESQPFPEGQRNQSLTRLAGSLRRNGMAEEAILISLTEANKRQCVPPLPDDDVQKISKSVSRYAPNIDKDTITNKDGNSNLYIDSRAVTENVTPATNRHKTVTENVTGDVTRPDIQPVTLASRVLEWVKGTNAWFTTDELDKELGIRDESEKHNRLVIFTRLKKQGVVEAHSKVNRQWRYVSTSLTHIDFAHAVSGGHLEVAWPLEIENWAHIFPGNIVVIAGAPNAGKTAFLLNFIWRNQDKFPIKYFCSEMGEDGIELRDRLEKFEGMEINEWHFDAYDRASNFEDVVDPDACNIIDYLEMTEDLWDVNKHLTAIYQKLKSGIAVVAIQKKVGALYGRGQEFGLEKPKIYLSLDKGQLTIVKGKAWATKQNPNGLKVKFNIIDGCQFDKDGEWYWEK